MRQLRYASGPVVLAAIVAAAFGIIAVFVTECAKQDEVRQIRERFNGYDRANSEFVKGQREKGLLKDEDANWPAAPPSPPTTVDLITLTR